MVPSKDMVEKAVIKLRTEQAGESTAILPEVIKVGRDGMFCSHLGRPCTDYLARVKKNCFQTGVVQFLCQFLKRGSHPVMTDGAEPCLILLERS